MKNALATILVTLGSIDPSSPTAVILATGAVVLCTGLMILGIILALR